jgi:hypothetical protein
MKKILIIIVMGLICGCSVPAPIDNFSTNAVVNTRFEVLVSERHGLDDIGHFIMPVILLDKTNQTQYLIINTDQGAAMIKIDEPK